MESYLHNQQVQERIQSSPEKSKWKFVLRNVEKLAMEKVKKLKIEQNEMWSSTMAMLSTSNFAALKTSHDILKAQQLSTDISNSTNTNDESTS